MTDKAKKANTTDAKSNFGWKGWQLIAFTGVMLYFCTGTTVDGLNVTVEAIAKLRGWQVAELLSFSTLSGLISIVGMFVFGLICDRIGARLTSAITLVLGGLSYMYMGHANSVLHYAIALCLVSIFTNAFSWIAGGAYLSAYFPRKKGLALGWATMGNNLASATIVLILNWLALSFGGIQWAMTIFGAVIALTAIWALLTPNRPEEVGMLPDNAAYPVTQKPTGQAQTSWSYKKILTTKQVWLISVGLGIYMLVTVGVMSQMVPRLIQIGFQQSEAILTMSICALIGVVGSYAWGVVDQLLSTRVATAIYGVWYAIAIALNLVPNIWAIYVSIFMIGVAIGGTANWPVSLTSTTFGSKNFAKGYSIINPFISCIRMFSFVALALSLSLTGSFEFAYYAFIALVLLGAFLIILVDDRQYAQDY